MNDIHLSVVVLFCDKDFKYVDGLCRQIEERVRVPHEIILVDNRDSIDRPCPDAFRTVVSGGNIGQYDARLEAVDKCRGEYIWFVDADDEVLPVAEELSGLDGDIIYFCARDRTGFQSEANPPSVRIRTMLHGKDSVSWSTSEYTITVTALFRCAALWQLWIRREFFEEHIHLFPRGKPSYKHNEDLFVQSVLLVNSSKVTFSSSEIYVYNKSLSAYNGDMTPERLEYLLGGYADIDAAAGLLLGRYHQLLMPKSNLYIMAILNFKTMREADIDAALRVCMRAFGKDYFMNIAQQSLFGFFPGRTLLSRISELCGRQLEYYEDRLKRRLMSAKSHQESAVHETGRPVVSVVVTLIDRDVPLIENLIAQINERVHVPHEVIVVDNRTSRKDEKIDFMDAVVIDKGRNLYQFESKRLASLSASGEYLWFIDADDEVLGIAADLDLGLVRRHDIISFSFVDSDGNRYGEPVALMNCHIDGYAGRYTERKNSDFCFFIMRNMTSVCTWNKWYRTEKFRAVAERVPSGKEIIIAEDEFWYASMIERTDSVLFCDDIVYAYHINSGITSRDEFPIDKYMLFTKGMSEIGQLAGDFLSDTHSRLIKFCTYGYLLYRTMSMSSEHDRMTACDFLIKNSSTAYMAMILSSIHDIYGFDRGQLEKFRHSLFDRLKIPCYGAGNIELYFDTPQKIVAKKCCSVYSIDERLGEFPYTDFLDVERKREWLDELSRRIPDGHPLFEHWMLKGDSTCNGTSWCDYSSVPLNKVTVACNSCNLACPMCRAEPYIDKNEVDHYYEVLESLRGLHLDVIFLTNRGEPFLQKERCFRWIESLTADDCEWVQGITNATLIDENDISRLAEISWRSGIKFLFMVSCDGITAGTYSGIRGRDYFDRCVSNILAFKRYGMLNTISIVIQEMNLHELNSMPGFWEKKGVPHDKLSLIMCESRNDEHFKNSLEKLLASSEYRQFVNDYPDIKISIAH